MSQNEDPDVKAELAALRAEVERLKGDTAVGDDPWKGLKEYSKSIEEGRLNDFLYDRGAPAWVQNLGVGYVFLFCAGIFAFIFFS